MSPGLNFQYLSSLSSRANSRERCSAADTCCMHLMITKPRANKAALPLVLPPSNPGDWSVGIAGRSTAPGGSRWRWATVMGPSCRIVVDRSELVTDDGERQPRGVALAGKQAGQPPGRGGG